MSKPPLLLTGRLHALTMEGVRRSFEVHHLWEAPDREALLAQLGPDLEAICTSGVTGVATDDALMARFPKLRIIANFGVGYDSIDADAAGRRGIVVTNTPDVLTEEVADTTIGLLLNTVRELAKAEAHLRAGRWETAGNWRLTHSLRDRKVGIAGLGRIGKAVARRLEAFQVPVSYWGRRRQSDVAYPYYPDLLAMCREVDTLIVLTPGGADTTNLVDAAVLGALGPRGVVINMSRGSAVDEAALISALEARRIHAAGLDVFLDEPRVNPKLLALDHLTLTPHVGSGSHWTREQMAQLVVDNLEAYTSRTPPRTPVPETPFKGW